MTEVWITGTGAASMRVSRHVRAASWLGKILDGLRGRRGLVVEGAECSARWHCSAPARQAFATYASAGRPEGAVAECDSVAKGHACSSYEGMGSAASRRG